MDEHTYLHDNERLLVSVRPSKSLLLWMWVQGIVPGIGIGALLGVIVGIGWWYGFQELAPLWLFILVLILGYAIVVYHKWRMWQVALLRATTERILFFYPGKLFSRSTKTVKWGQFQEAYAKKMMPLDLFFKTKSLCLRYGTAQGETISCFPALRFATDLKHYFDKVDSKVRSNQVVDLKPFVPKPRGERD